MGRVAEPGKQATHGRDGAEAGGGFGQWPAMAVFTNAKAVWGRSVDQGRWRQRQSRCRRNARVDRGEEWCRISRTVAGGNGTRIPGGFTDISVGDKDVWGVNDDGVWKCAKPCDDGAWQRIATTYTADGIGCLRNPSSCVRKGLIRSS